jgi:hypothetical protein
VSLSLFLPCKHEEEVGSHGQTAHVKKINKERKRVAVRVSSCNLVFSKLNFLKLKSLCPMTNLTVTNWLHGMAWNSNPHFLFMIRNVAEIFNIVQFREKTVFVAKGNVCIDSTTFTFF